MTLPRAHPTTRLTGKQPTGPTTSAEDAENDERLVLITPLGRWGVRQRHLWQGGEAPVVTDIAYRSAADLLGTLGVLRADDADLAVNTWVGSRPHAQAARELFDAAREQGAVARTAAMAIVTQVLSDVAEPVLNSYLGDELIGPYALAWLADQVGSEAGAVLTLATRRGSSPWRASSRW